MGTAAAGIPVVSDGMELAVKVRRPGEAEASWSHVMSITAEVYTIRPLTRSQTSSHDSHVPAVPHINDAGTVICPLYFVLS